MTGEQIVVAVLAAMWIVATVRGIRRLDAADEYRRRSEALRRVTGEQS
jgi:hypothetical protein